MGGSTGARGRDSPQPAGGTPARRASSSKSLSAFCVVFDLFLEAAELGERLQAVALNAGALNGIRPRREIGSQGVDPALHRIDEDLVAIERGLELFPVAGPVGLALRQPVLAFVVPGLGRVPGRF